MYSIEVETPQIFSLLASEEVAANRLDDAVAELASRSALADLCEDITISDNLAVSPQIVVDAFGADYDLCESGENKDPLLGTTPDGTTSEFLRTKELLLLFCFQLLLLIYKQLLLSDGVYKLTIEGPAKFQYASSSSITRSETYKVLSQTLEKVDGEVGGG